MFHAVYSRYTEKFSWQEETLGDAVDTIRVGEDDGMIFGIAVYDDSANVLYMPHPDFLDDKKVRHDVERVLGRSIANAVIMPFPVRVEEE